MKVDELLKDAEIVDKFTEMVCIRLENGTPTCGQFAAIYPVILIPSIYFIGDPWSIYEELFKSKLFFVDSSSGVDIEITGGSISKDGLLNSFKKVAEKIGSAPQTSEAGAMSATPAQAAQQAPAASVSLQERVERAKMLVEQRKMEKQKDEDDKEKNKEMERREVGKVRTV